MDMTYFGAENGLLVLAEKRKYSFHYRNEEFFGKRCIPLIYIFTRSRDNSTLSSILLAIKSYVSNRAGIMNPKNIFIDFDQASAVALSEIFPNAIIRFCYIHMYRAFKKKCLEICGSKQRKIAIRCAVEFSRFWHSTFDLNSFQDNMKIFEANIDIISGKEIKGKIWKYFNKYYIEAKNVFPERWLHMYFKKDSTYDSTNNSVETLNNVLKIFELKRIFFLEVFNKIIKQLDLYEKMSDNLEYLHNYEYSIEASKHRKKRREEKKEEQYKKLLQKFQLQEYFAD
eukprot:TRINITY_DN2256_c0_g1_i2.p1 TRINITY_DN2256_c0_g1~~TRINITY_DN2256_c0_g1_i2.p1  ORF type:complete len:284 (+),score=46.61 TRINITY_DN2256_c0_g1_i2:646-1497(+)